MGIYRIFSLVLTVIILCLLIYIMYSSTTKEDYDDPFKSMSNDIKRRLYKLKSDTINKITEKVTPELQPEEKDSDMATITDEGIGYSENTLIDNLDVKKKKKRRSHKPTEV